MRSQDFIEQIVKEIDTNVAGLDEPHRRDFLFWLGDHAVVRRGSQFENLPEKLASWLDVLDPAGILWEYRLLLCEIEWWSKQETR